MKRKNAENIAPFVVRSGEEARTKGRAGGIASGKARRKARTMRQWAEILRDLPAPGPGETNAGAAVLAMYEKAQGGSVAAFQALADLMGETSSRSTASAQAVNVSPIVLGMIPPEMIEEAKRERPGPDVY